MTSTGDRSTRRDRRRAIADCVFLGAVVFLSVVLHVGGLGFYSDDWAFLAPMHLSEDRSFPGVFTALYAAPENRMRPVAFMTIAGLYRLFGLNPLGYHLANTLLLTAGAVFCYLSLRKLTPYRSRALAVPTVYILLPHYSAARFWVTAITHATTSMTWYFVSLFSALQMVRSRGRGAWAWGTIALVALAVSVLAYELFLPLFFLNVLLAWWHGRRADTSGVEGGRRRVAILASATMMAVAALTTFKLVTTIRQGHTHVDEQGAWFWWIFTGALRLSYGELGVQLPLIVWRILSEHAEWRALAISIGIGLVVGAYMLYVSRAEARLSAWRTDLVLVLSGVVVFCLGYAIFLGTKNAQNSLAGISNRVALAGALGVAVTAVGLFGLIEGILPRPRWRATAFALPVALTCAGNALILTTLGGYWARAWDIEQEVLARIHHRFPTLPEGTTLLLDGVCPYVGPAVVFEASWDLASALRADYRDWSLTADVVTPNLTVQDDALVATLYYGALVTRYPYDRLIVYDYRRDRAQRLPNAAAARAYFAQYNPRLDSGCPKGQEGHGVAVFQ